MKRVFISYSRKDGEVVSQLINDLKAMGIDTWHDQSLAGGQHWWEDILANIRNCDIFVLALSLESWGSEACKSELHYVLQLGKPILPVMVADGVNINFLSAPINEIQITDYRKCDKEAAFSLVRSINITPMAPPLPDPLPPEPPVPVSYVNSLNQRLESMEPLGIDAQIMLLFDLEEELRERRSLEEIRDLLVKFRRRPELLAKVAIKIDAALKSLEERSAHKRAPERAQPNAAKTPKPNEAAARYITCPKCRTLVEEGPRFCGSCGAELWTSSGAQNQPHQQPHQSPPQQQFQQQPQVQPPQPLYRSQPPQPFYSPHNSIPPNGPLPPNVPQISGSKTRRYSCSAGHAPQMLIDIKNWLNDQNFDVQQMNVENQGLLLQVKKRGNWRDFVGMSTSLNILFYQSSDTLTVVIGGGKWIDKAAVGTVSMFVLWPLAITAGFGAWEQMKMPEKIFDYIGSKLVYR